MSTAPIALPPTTECDALPGADADDAWARARLERQLGWLDRLAEAGVEIVEGLQADVGNPEADRGDAARAYARASRTVRQTILLQSKLVKDFDGREAAGRQARADAKAEADKTLQERTELRKCHVSWIIDRVANARHDDTETVERLTREADERLDDDSLLGDVLARPISETVARICKGLNLDPDWTRLAEEAWAQEELASGDVGWPLTRQRVLPRERQRTGEDA
jgi:hypothetical protein